MELNAQKRDIAAIKAKALRKEGMIPAELYGHGQANVHLVVNAKEFNKVYREAGESTVITLVVDKAKMPALIYDVVMDPIEQTAAHIDFYAVKMNEAIVTEVPFEFVGESMAVKTGGVLVKSAHEVEVRALPADLPHSIVVDLSALANVHDSIHIGDLKVSGKVKLMGDPEMVVATVIEPMTEEEASGPATVAEVKVEGEEKKKEREAEKA